MIKKIFNWLLIGATAIVVIIVPAAMFMGRLWQRDLSQFGAISVSGKLAESLWPEVSAALAVVAIMALVTKELFIPSLNKKLLLNLGLYVLLSIGVAALLWRMHLTTSIM